MARHCETFDHTADMAYEVEGASFAELLRNATAALGDVVLDVEAASFEETRPLEVHGADREDVLVAWLNEVVVAFEDEGYLAWDAEVEHADAQGARGALRGRTLDLSREQPDRVVKAVTYHDLSVVEGRDGTLISFTSRLQGAGELVERIEARTNLTFEPGKGTQLIQMASDEETEPEKPDQPQQGPDS